MSTPTFNDAETYGLTKLSFENGGYSGKLAGTGNTVQVTIDPLSMKEVQASPAGVAWTSQRTLGRSTRRITWDIQLKATANGGTADESLNAVEAYIEAYFVDGRTFTITDGRGRSSDHARLNSQLTRRVGQRVTLRTGDVMQRWQLVFEVLKPQTGATKL